MQLSDFAPTSDEAEAIGLDAEPANLPMTPEQESLLEVVGERVDVINSYRTLLDAGHLFATNTPSNDFVYARLREFCLQELEILCGQRRFAEKADLTSEEALALKLFAAQLVQKSSPSTARTQTAVQVPTASAPKAKVRQVKAEPVLKTAAKAKTQVSGGVAPAPSPPVANKPAGRGAVIQFEYKDGSKGRTNYRRDQLVPANHPSMTVRQLENITAMQSQRQAEAAAETLVDTLEGRQLRPSSVRADMED